MTKSWPLAFFSLIAGIVLAYYQLGAVAIAAILLLLTSGILLKEYSFQFYTCLLVLLAGFLYAVIMIIDLPPSLPVIQTSLAGTVQGFPYCDGEKTTFILKTEKSSTWTRKIRVVCYFEVDISRGDRLSLKGILKPPRRPGNPGEFNFPLYLSHNGIYYNLAVKQASDLSLIGREKGPLLWVDRFRARGETLTKKILPERESAILLGMLLGTREGIEEEQYDAFQKTGIIHLFSVSGLHVGFLLLLVGWISSLLALSNRSKFFAGVTILIIYGTMIAWPVCVIRAVLMGILGLLAYYSGRENGLLNALAIAGVITLLINPASLFTISFQLTFLATWGLLYIFPILREALPLKGWFWDMIWLPLSAELAVLPLIAYYFNILTPVSILTNILVTYISGLAVILGFVTFLLAAFIPILAPLFLYPAGFCVELILLMVRWVQYLPGGYIWVATPAIAMIILYFASIFIGLLGLHNPYYRKLLWPALGIWTVFFIVLLLPASCYNRGYLEADFIDVGQGDAILLKSPRGKFVLIDGGGNALYEVGKTTVLPYLHRRGIRELTLLVNTHPDNDHLQGVESVAEELAVENIAVPGSLSDCNEYGVLKQIAVRRRLPIISLQSGNEINIEEGLRIKVLHPGNQTFSKNSNNNQSVVLRISYREFSILLTGDIEAEAMQALLDDGQLTPTTIVKVPHHGSKGSLLPEFYQQTQPRYAVISVGANNLFGHPHPNTLAMLKQQNIQLLRTDQDGAVIIFSDGKKMFIHRTRTAVK